MLVFSFINASRSGEIPADAIDMGFSKHGAGPTANEPFNMRSGFRDPSNHPPTFDTHYWFELFFLEAYWPEMLKHIRLSGLGIGIFDDELLLRWRKYTLIQLFMGLHCLPEEIDYFTHFRGGMSVLEFYFGENIFSHDEFV